MIEIGKYYICDTPSGSRTLKCMQYDGNNKPYGLYSPSNYQNEGDAQGLEISEMSNEASENEASLWNAWYD